MLNDRLDFAVIEGGVSHALLRTKMLLRDRLVPVLPPDSEYKNKNSVLLNELIHAPLLLRESGSAGRSFLNHIFAAHGIHISPIMESVSTHAILQAVHAGAGISFLPEQLVKEHILSGFVSSCQVADEPFYRDNCLVWHKQKFLTKSAQEAMSLFETLCNEKATSSPGDCVV